MAETVIDEPSDVVGIVSIIASGYCIVLFAVQLFCLHESSKLVLFLSYTNLLCMSIAAGFIAATYYQPYMWTESCWCHFEWAASLIAYIIALYTMKASYIARVYILNDHPTLGNHATTQAIRVVTGSLSLTLFINIVCMIVLTEGSCHPYGYGHNGCITSFHVGDLYMAFFMITIDLCLFFCFCYKWYGIVRILQLCGEKIPMDLIQVFTIQFILTIIAMLSCVFDSVMHLILGSGDNGQYYRHTMIFYLLDIMIIATCNFAMIKESQTRIFKCLCYCLRNTKFVRNFNARAESFSVGYDKNGNKIKTNTDKLHIHGYGMAAKDGSKDKTKQMHKVINVPNNNNDNNNTKKRKKSKSNQAEITDTTDTSDKRREIVSESDRKREITPTPRQSLTITMTNTKSRPLIMTDINKGEIYNTCDGLKEEEEEPLDTAIQLTNNSKHSPTNSTTVTTKGRKSIISTSRKNTGASIAPPVLTMAVAQSVQ